MFPYGMIIAANMLNKQGQRQSNPPKINTLNDYTEFTPEQVYDLLVTKAKTVGICEMADMITNWQNFDSLSDVKKRLFLADYAPEGMIGTKPTIIERLKDYFKIGETK
jgi:hypothetical protein